MHSAINNLAMPFADTPDKRRAAGRLTHDPVALNAFINDQKQAIAQANKAMKEKNNVVKLDKKRVKSAWFAKLKQIAS